MQAKKTITARMKVGELLLEYPELEDVLLKLSPRFQKLKNPVLSATVAKIASLRQVADMGEIPLAELIRTLRAAVGESGPEIYEEEIQKSGLEFDVKEPAITVDARPLLDRGEEPLSLVMSELGRLKPSQTLKLVTPFVPAPLIELAKKQGYQCFIETSAPGAQEVFTYFRKR